MPLALTDAQMVAVLNAARPIPREDRDHFLQAIADALRDQAMLGDGVVHRTIVEVQRRFLSPPTIDDPRPRHRTSEIARRP